jgi:rubrerythrin
MTDEVKGKKISDFAYWIRLKSEVGDATILAFKRPESEKKAIGAEASITEAKVGAQYSKETEGNTWDTIIVTKEYGMLPVDTWKTKVGTEKIRNAVVSTTGASMVYVGPVKMPSENFYRCKNCGEVIAIVTADGLCPSCGKKFTV